MTEAGRRGLVTVRHRREAIVEDNDGETFSALVRGRKLKPLPGDRVAFELSPDGTAVIHEILPRESLLERIDKRGRREGVAANVSLIAIVVAPKPAPDWQLVDRYLLAAASMPVDAALVRNKIDREDDALDERALTYRRLAYALISTSAETMRGIDELVRVLAGHRGVLVGQSGVGKSSLINALLARKAQATGHLSARKPIGRHTTTAAMLYRLPGGGELIDSPGVRRYSPAISDAAALAAGFVEFRPLIGRCRFADCRHVNEPGCAVVEAVGSGEISAQRYDSYRAILDTTERLAADRERGA